MYSAQGFFGKSLPVRTEVGAGRASPLLCAAIWRRGILWEVGTSYNERRLLWEAVCFVWAVTCVRRIPRRRRGRACRLSLPGQPAFMLRARRARRVLWEAVRFIMREGFFGKSRAGGAKKLRVQPARIFPKFWIRSIRKEERVTVTTEQAMRESGIYVRESPSTSRSVNR